MKVVGFGDLLVRLGPSGYKRFLQAEKFEVNYTGAEANVCVALSQMGMDAHFVTRIPNNAIAQCAVACLNKFGVDTDGIVYGGDRIGIYYVEKGASQRPSRVIYDRMHTAICEARPEHFAWPTLLKGASCFHFTGITAALSDTMPAVLLDALKCAKEAGVMVSCDLNYRKKLWTTQSAGHVMRELLPWVDVLIANEEDADKVLGIRAANSDIDNGQLSREGYADVARQLQQRFGCKYVAVSLRKSISASDNDWSIMLYNGKEALFSREYRIHLVDRVGGGDAFAAGLIYALGMGYDEKYAVEFAAAASCLKQTIEYDFNLVSVSEIEQLVHGAGSGRVER